jgi:hypothetical protein
MHSEEDQTQVLRNHIWLIPAIILAAFGVVFFLITEDMNSLIVLLWDQWTIANAVAFTGVIVTTKLAIREEMDNEQDYGFVSGVKSI